MNDRDFHTELKQRRAVLVEQYHTFRKCAAILIKRGVIHFDKDRHRYAVITTHPHYRRGTWRDLRAAQKLMELQMQIKDQAVRLLELEDIIK